MIIERNLDAAHLSIAILEHYVQKLNPCQSENCTDTFPMESVSWLHLTDWHVGQALQGPMWPNFQESFVSDLQHTVGKIGPIDLVFFTGDLVQSGTPSEYIELEERLQYLWSVFLKLGSTPVLVTVPGNHDLCRPVPTNPAYLALKSWSSEPSVRDAFWSENDSSLRDEVVKWFESYSNWKLKTTVPLLHGAKGILPGDLLAKYQKNNLQIGLLGLNTTFLQCSSGDFEGKLATHPRQAHALSENFLTTIEECDIKVLLTHHPTSWLDPKSAEYLEGDVAPSGRFDAHFCGHLHTPFFVSQSIAGFAKKQTYQGYAFFGLERFGPNGEEIRSQGYIAGKWSKEGSKIEEVIYPRVGNRRYDKSWGIVPDYKNHLQNECLTREWQLRTPFKVGVATRSYVADHSESSAFDAIFAKAPPDALSRFPRLSCERGQKQHSAIRAEERSQLRALLDQHGIVCIAADWGTGKDQFVAAALEMTSLTLEQQPSVFVLKCDAVEIQAELEPAFKQQFGASFDQFVNAIAFIENAYLVLDGIQPSFADNKHKSGLLRICSVLRDYSSNLRIIVIGRRGLGEVIPEVQIGPLDPPETRIYIENHPLSQSDLLSVDAIERIHFATGGLPVQLDDLLERTQVALLETVLSEGSHLRPDNLDQGLHKSLVHCIRMLALKEREGSGTQSLSLLRALTVLPYGETIEGIKRFWNNRSFSATDAKQLHSLALVDIIPIFKSTANPSSGAQLPTTSAAKILRAPKQVRDSVWDDMEVSEKRSFLYAAAEFIFHADWRTGGKIRLRKVPAEYRDHVISGVGNEFSVVNSLLLLSIEQGKTEETKKIARLGIHYAGILKGADRSRDLRHVCNALIKTLEPCGLLEEAAQLHGMCAKASRLTGNYDEGVAHCQSALSELESRRSRNKSIEGAYLNELASGLIASDRKDEAREIVNKALSLAKPGSLLESHMQAKLARLATDKSDSQAKLRTLEERARSKGWHSHANDIALSTLYKQTAATDRIAKLDTVLASGEGGWNQHRAILRKAEIVLKSNLIAQFSILDRVRLIQAYAYYHAQRLDRLDDCHKCIWEFYEREGNLLGLYALFHNSSFVWRIRGADSLELEYYERLVAFEQAVPARTPPVNKRPSLLVELEYFAKRAKVLILRIVSR